jgi:hypothetical protein
MNKEELAQLLNGRQYRRELTKDEEAAAKDSGLVVVFGASDDLLELRGALRDEYGCGENEDHLFDSDGKALPHDIEDHAEWLKEHGMLNAFMERFRNKITSHWCGKGMNNATPEDEDISWQYSTNIPCATFQILDEGDVYCVGLVFSMTDLK